MVMQILDVGSNNISGNLSVIENMPIATEFRFDGNALTGRVPSVSPIVQVWTMLPACPEICCIDSVFCIP